MDSVVIIANLVFNNSIMWIFLQIRLMPIGGGRNEELDGQKNGVRSAPRFWPHPLFGAYKWRVLGVSLQPRTGTFIDVFAQSEQTSLPNQVRFFCITES